MARARLIRILSTSCYFSMSTLVDAGWVGQASDSAELNSPTHNQDLTLAHCFRRQTQLIIVTDSDMHQLNDSENEERNVRYVQAASRATWEGMAKTVREVDEAKVGDCKDDIDTLLVFVSITRTSVLFIRVLQALTRPPGRFVLRGVVRVSHRDLHGPSA